MYLSLAIYFYFKLRHTVTLNGNILSDRVDHFQIEIKFLDVIFIHLNVLVLLDFMSHRYGSYHFSETYNIIF